MLQAASLTLLLLTNSVLGSAKSDAAELGIDGAAAAPKNFSYVCLESFDHLCLGISTGAELPEFKPGKVYWAQVKSRQRNEFLQSDFKKTRWDVQYNTAEGGIILSFTGKGQLCLSKQRGSSRVGLFPCSIALADNASPSNSSYGKWDLTPWKVNLTQSGPLRILNGKKDLCLTVMDCQADGKGFCNELSTDPATDQSGEPDGLKPGAYLRLAPCYDSPDGFAYQSIIQRWKNRFDCAPGCTPFLQFNDRCDQVCNNKACNFDEEFCVTKSPTPPTNRPSKSPTQKPTIANSPTLPPAPTTTKAPTIPCPAAGVLESCSRFTSKKMCTKGKKVNKKCLWCLNSCKPRAGVDARICADPNLYDHCKPTPPPGVLPCPTRKSYAECLRIKELGACNKRPDCTWCSNTGDGKKACRPTKDKRVCPFKKKQLRSLAFPTCPGVGNPTFPTVPPSTTAGPAPSSPPAPASGKCPSNYAISKCKNAGSADECRNDFYGAICTWCGTKSKCQPGKDRDICADPKQFLNTCV